MTILERLDRALAELEAHWTGRRKPKAFYLSPADWAEWRAATSNPPIVRVPFGNNPTVWRDEPAYRDVPVRESRSSQSRLYDDTTTGRAIK